MVESPALNAHTIHLRSGVHKAHDSDTIFVYAHCDVRLRSENVKSRYFTSNLDRVTCKRCRKRHPTAWDKLQWEGFLV